MNALGTDDVNTFKMKTECKSFGSRASGIKARLKIENILCLSEGRPLEFDFEGVSIISSSFADEVFGRLFSQLKAMQFLQKIKFKNTNSDIAFLIDRAIEQRVNLNVELAIENRDKMDKTDK